jgi:hypothetical protein
MKKFVFALEMMSLMLVLPVYMVVELNRPAGGTENAVYFLKNGPGKKGVKGDMDISLPAPSAVETHVK